MSDPRARARVEELFRANHIALDDFTPGRHYTICPRCSAQRSNAHRTLKCLGVTIEADDTAFWGCNHCGWTGPGKHDARDPQLTAYIYRDVNGEPRFRKVRNVPGREPRFFLQQPDGNGWLKGTKGVDTGILYRIDEVAKAIAEGGIVCIAEGEKDVDNLWRLGFAATCNAHGASEFGKTPKWYGKHSAQLKGANLVVFNDNDVAGYAHADMTCKLSIGLAKRVRRLDLRDHWPDIPKGGDVSDWIAAGHGREELAARIDGAPDYEGGPPPPLGRGGGTVERPYEIVDGEPLNGVAGPRIFDKADSGPRAFAPIEGEDDAPPVAFTPTPFTWRDPAMIPHRQFVYGRHYVRGFVSASLAPGGVGKSSLALVEAVAMATGRNLLGIQPPKGLKVWYVNLEDPREEIERRVAAICLRYGIKADEIEERFFFDGRETEIIIASQTKSGAVLAVPVLNALKEAIAETAVDVVVIDPFVSVHRVTENDNTAIDAVAKALGRLAGETNTAIELVHHTRKNGGAEVTAEDGRGASAQVAAARSVRVLNRMTETEANQAGVDCESRRRYFRVEVDKANLAPPAKATWCCMVSVALGNGSDAPIDDQDYVGVATPWTWPDAFAGVTVTDLRAVQAAVAAGRWRESPQAKDWAGYAVASVLKLDTTNKAHRAKIAALLKTWIANDMLTVAEDEDEHRKKRNFIEVGTPASD